MQGECEEAAPQELTNRMAGLCELLSGSASLDQWAAASRFPSVSSERCRAGAQISGAAAAVSVFASVEPSQHSSQHSEPSEIVTVQSR